MVLIVQLGREILVLCFSYQCRPIINYHCHVYLLGGGDLIINETSSIITCAALNLTNGEVTYNLQPTMTGGYPIDTAASFMCSSGYDLSGSNSSICQTSGNWREEIPTCNGNGILKRSLFPNFTFSNKEPQRCCAK